MMENILKGLYWILLGCRNCGLFKVVLIIQYKFEYMNQIKIWVRIKPSFDKNYATEMGAQIFFRKFQKSIRTVQKAPHRKCSKKVDFFNIYSR